MKQLALVRAKLLKDDLGDVERVVSTLDDAAEAARRPGADWESSSETAAAAAISRKSAVDRRRSPTSPPRPRSSSRPTCRSSSSTRRKSRNLSRPSASSPRRCR